VPPVAETEKDGKVWLLLMVEDEEKRLEDLNDDKSDAEEEEEKGKGNVVNLHIIFVNVCDFVSTNILHVWWVIQFYYIYSFHQKRESL
jgi:hypothetical protein